MDCDRGAFERVKRVLTPLIRFHYTNMSDPNKNELHGRDATLDDGELDPAAAQAGSGEKAGSESHTEQVNTSNNKELEIKPCKNSSTVSLEQRSTHDVEKGLPAETQAEKEPAVTDAEHDPNIVDWDGDADPENPLNWIARKKWYLVPHATISFDADTSPG